MFIVLLKFSANRNQAGQFMAGHKDWIQRGFDEGVFLLSGSLLPGVGGVVLAHATTREQLQQRVSEDPFVAADVVNAEIIETAPSRAAAALSFLVT